MRIKKLLKQLTDAGLQVGNNPVEICDQYGITYPITEINTKTGDIFIVIERGDD